MRMSREEYRAQAERPKRNKYGAKRVVLDGITFDSTKESKRYLQLRERQRKGEITQLECQPRFRLAVGDRPILIRSEGYPNGRQASVKFDFAYWDGERRVIEDVKGGRATRTEAYVLRKAVVEAMHPAVRVVEV